MYSIGAFLGGKVMAVYPNEYKYYEELYKFAIDLAMESGVFIEVRYFDSDAYKEMMELLREATPISEEMKQQVLHEIDQQIESESKTIWR